MYTQFTGLLLLYECLKSAQRQFPLLPYGLQSPLGFCDLTGFELPETFSSDLDVSHHAGVRQHL